MKEFKRVAKQWARAAGVKHTVGLECLARACKFQNYHAMQKTFQSNPDDARFSVVLATEDLDKVFTAESNGVS